MALPLPLSTFGTGIWTDDARDSLMLPTLDIPEAFDGREFDLDRRLGTSLWALKKGFP